MPETRSHSFISPEGKVVTIRTECGDGLTRVSVVEETDKQVELEASE